MTSDATTVIPILPEGSETSRSATTLVRHVLVVLTLVVTVVGAVTLGFHYWTVGRFQEETDDAYVKADISSVAPKVSGYIDRVLVGDNEHVFRGQVLATIDARDLKTALEQARAEVQSDEAALSNLDARIAMQQSVIARQQAAVASTQAALPLAEDNVSRYRKLIRTSLVSAQRTQQAETTLLEVRANLRRDLAGLEAAKKEVDVLTTAREQATAKRAHSQAVLKQAELNFSYATIRSPVDGTVGARSVRIGQYVQAGTPLLAVVPLDQVYVIANYKESQLTHVHQGQAVSLRVDGFPDLKITGQVDSLAPASGLEFSLLPPDNATGNFTKIVQRIPVKIVFDDRSTIGKLRPGMSVQTSIDTRYSAPRRLARHRAANSANEESVLQSPGTKGAAS